MKHQTSIERAMSQHGETRGGCHVERVESARELEKLRQAVLSCETLGQLAVLKDSITNKEKTR